MYFAFFHGIKTRLYFAKPIQLCLWLFVATFADSFALYNNEPSFRISYFCTRMGPLRRKYTQRGFAARLNLYALPHLPTTSLYPLSLSLSLPAPFFCCALWGASGVFSGNFDASSVLLLAGSVRPSQRVAAAIAQHAK